MDGARKREIADAVADAVTKRFGNVLVVADRRYAPLRPDVYSLALLALDVLPPSIVPSFAYRERLGGDAYGGKAPARPRSAPLLRSPLTWRACPRGR